MLFRLLKLFDLIVNIAQWGNNTMDPLTSWMIAETAKALRVTFAV